VEDKETSNSDLVQLARLALSGRSQDVQLYLRRLLRRYRNSDPRIAEGLESLLRDVPTRSSPLRKEGGESSLPVDLDSRLHLIRCETITELDVEPVYDEPIWTGLRQLVCEHHERERLEHQGLSPTRSVLLTGPPGVGKTLAARWLARELCLPLLTLDLSAVMSSFLGRTGNNVRHVLDYAKGVDGILLLDELDAIAKRRDDVTEIGELKRLVTVLLQEIDDWPAGGLLVAATNHADLLDPAVWRRFELSIEFPMPDKQAVREAVEKFLGTDAEHAPTWAAILSIACAGASFSDIEREIMLARRATVVSGQSSTIHFRRLIANRAQGLSRKDRRELALELVRSKVLSQREAHELTGVSRDTIRKASHETG